jgi:hypothetical protein
MLTRYQSLYLLGVRVLVICGVRSDIAEVASVFVQFEVRTRNTSINVSIKFAACGSSCGIQVSCFNGVNGAISVSRTDIGDVVLNMPQCQVMNVQCWGWQSIILPRPKMASSLTTTVIRRSGLCRNG